MARRVDAILGDILSRGNLESPDGRPLYAYRVTKAEVEQLGHSIRASLDWNQNLTSAVCGGFCLYLAERFRERHVGGSWQWATALEDLSPDMPWGDLHRNVERGLAYWHRSLLQLGDRTGYLVTIACEGGLPLGLLKREGTHLRRFFTRLLRDRENYPELDIEQCARHWAHILPATLQNETVVSLACQLVDALLEPRRMTADVPDPILHLDSIDVGWRDRVPLRLEDDLARRLLQGLLQAPRGREATSDVYVESHLRMGPGVLIEKDCVFPSTIETEVLARHFGSSLEKLPSRFRLALIGESDIPYSFAIVTLHHGGREFRIDAIQSARTPNGPEAVGRFDLAVVQQGKVVGRTPVAGGERLPDLPWVFTDGAGGSQQRMLGAGSVRTTAPSALVALDENWSIEDGDCEQIIDLGKAHRRVYRVKGVSRFARGDELVVVRTRADQDDERRFMLKGRISTAGAGGSIVWCGVPRILLCPDVGVARPVPAQDVRWKPAGGGGWGRSQSADLGDGELVFVEERETRFKAPVTIVPGDFRIACIPSGRPNVGEIRIDCVGLLDVAVKGQPGLECQVECRASGATVTVALDESTQLRQPFVTIALMFDGSRRATVSVPFPGKQIAFVGPDGQSLGRGDHVCLDEISDIRARAFDRRAREKYHVEAIIDGDRMVLGELFERDTSCKELPLDSVRRIIEELFDAGASLDTLVELRIVCHGVQEPGGYVTLMVTRFEGVLESLEIPGLDGRVFGAKSAEGSVLDAERVARLRVSASPIWDPSGDSCLLDDGPFEGSWILRQDSVQAGPWLVTARIGDRLALRPRAVMMGGAAGASTVAEGSGAPDGLQAAARMEEGPRLVRLQKLVAELSCSPDHEEWEVLNSYLESLVGLPSDTFDVTKRLVEDPDCVALSALKSSRRAWFLPFWDGLANLPFSWSTVPVRSWLRAGRRLREAREEALAKLPAEIASEHDASDLTKRVIRSLCEQAGHRLPAMDTIADTMLHLMNICPPSAASSLRRADTPEGERALEVDLEEQRNKLRIRHEALARADWPHHGMGPGRVLRSAGLDPSGDKRIPWLDPTWPAFNHVLNAPVIAAAISVFGDYPPPEARSWIELMRAFDEEWFDKAHGLVVPLLIARQLRKAPEFFDD